eukprot:COSAG04_NODE_902_length_9536_cov_20.105447_2_plen_308_part_00
MSARHCAAWASVRAGPTAAPRWSSTIGTRGNSVARACSAGTASARRQHAGIVSQEQREWRGLTVPLLVLAEPAVVHEAEVGQGLEANLERVVVRRCRGVGACQGRESPRRNRSGGYSFVATHRGYRESCECGTCTPARPALPDPTCRSPSPGCPSRRAGRAPFGSCRRCRCRRRRRFPGRTLPRRRGRTGRPCACSSRSCLPPCRPCPRRCARPARAALPRQPPRPPPVARPTTPPPHPTDRQTPQTHGRSHVDVLEDLQQGVDALPVRADPKVVYSLAVVPEVVVRVADRELRLDDLLRLPDRVIV